jgi:hypothetical protein
MMGDGVLYSNAIFALDFLIGYYLFYGAVPGAQPLGAGGADMRVGVVGLWHLGVVTAGCRASVGHQVVGLEDDAEALQALQ